MRDIKFRIKNLEGWIYFWIYDLIIDDVCRYNVLESNKDTIWQYTWTKDINWNEIYNWDIVSLYHDKDWDVKWVVEFSDIWARIHYWSFFYPLDYYCKSKQCKIIWNIYENPELINN